MIKVFILRNLLCQVPFAKCAMFQFHKFVNFLMIYRLYIHPILTCRRNYSKASFWHPHKKYIPKRFLNLHMLHTHTHLSCTHFHCHLFGFFFWVHLGTQLSGPVSLTVNLFQINWIMFRSCSFPFCSGFGFIVLA